ncbi:MAG: hypothetical protein HY731_00775 [Candidatus Tectomicrobia bacterium]|nr:hypothetical protein [Candidatus Tectomicrobia bacterium]
MSHVGEYFDRIFLTALGSSKAKRVEKVRQAEDATGYSGFIRDRLTLTNDDLLELTEYVEIQAGEMIVTRYRHHWQNKEGQCIKRWGNAPHHRQVSSFPHHLHDGAEENVVEHLPVNALQILNLVMQSIEQ